MSIALIAAWFAIVLFLGGTQYYSDVLFAMMVMVVPAILIAILLIGVPLWLGIRIALSLYRREFGRAARMAAIIVVGAAVACNGPRLADIAVVQLYKDRYLAQVEAMRQGRAERPVEGLFQAAFGRATIAFWRTGGSLYHVEGIAYDDSDSIAEILPMRISDRPSWWPVLGIEILACQGVARPLGGHFYFAHVSGKRCE